MGGNVEKYMAWRTSIYGAHSVNGKKLALVLLIEGFLNLCGRICTYNVSISLYDSGDFRLQLPYCK